MSIAVMTAAWTAAGITHTAKIVLLALADNSNDAGVCWPSIPKIAERCSLKERAVIRAIATLEGGGHLTTESRPGKSSVYRVHPCQPDTPVPKTPVSERHPCLEDTPVAETCTPVLKTPPITSGVLISSSVSETSRTQNLKRETRARARSRTVPEDFEITDRMRSWAKEKCPHVDVDRETEAFRDHEFRDPHSNWEGAWRQWMRRSPDFKSNGRVQHAGKKTFDERMAALDREIERVEGKQ